MPGIREVVFYIHGVSSELEGRDHSSEYLRLHEGIGAADVPPEWPAEFGGAEWGWPFDGADTGSHRRLTAAQAALGAPVLDLIHDQTDFTINPTRIVVNGLRATMLLGFGDIFYYVSGDGKRAIRQSICDQLLDYIGVEDGTQYSLTLLGHSAGSVVAFDFLYYLFTQRTRRQYLGLNASDSTVRGLGRLKQLVTDQQLRLRRLITFGSPISMVAFRNDAVVDIFARSETLHPEDYGLTSMLEDQPSLDGPRWINIWDKDDPIAFPIAPIMNSPLAEDLYVSVSDLVGQAHTAYWESEDVHAAIAERW